MVLATFRIAVIPAPSTGRVLEYDFSCKSSVLTVASALRTVSKLAECDDHLKRVSPSTSRFPSGIIYRRDRRLSDTLLGHVGVLLCREAEYGEKEAAIKSAMSFIDYTLEVVDVPAFSPPTLQLAKEWSMIWPVNFRRPSRYELSRLNVFSYVCMLLLGSLCLVLGVRVSCNTVYACIRCGVVRCSLVSEATSALQRQSTFCACLHWHSCTRIDIIVRSSSSSSSSSINSRSVQTWDNRTRTIINGSTLI